MERIADRTPEISTRERDCLRLIALGASSGEVAWKLRIATSTVEKHLASVRRKLDVKRTAQAVSYFRTMEQNKSSVSVLIEHRLSQDNPSLTTSQFVDDMYLVRSYEMASIVLNKYLASFGFDQHILGLVAEPAGKCTTGARLVGTTYPEELMRLYRQCGGEATDPIPRQVAVSTESFQVDLFDIIKKQVNPQNRQLTEFGNALADMNLGKVAVTPSRDFGTGAPISLAVGIRPEIATEYIKNRNQINQRLRHALDVFWMTVRRENLLESMSTLSLKQREVLRYCARGFTIDQMVEPMGISSRSVEKLLSNARSRLQVRTTAAAVFRAMVYGAL